LLSVPFFLLGTSPATARTEDEVVLGQGTHALSLVNGPDGKLWFAGVRYAYAGFSDVVGAVDLEEGVMEIPLPNPNFSGARGIAVGRDGNLWYADPDANEIGRLTPGGQISHFALPTQGAMPTTIVAGPDGALWFTEQGSSAIGRIDLSGSIKEYPLTPGSGPVGIALGPDGALWIAETAASRISRMTPDGTFSEFPLPKAGLLPEGIVAGPDGALWFTERGASVIGRIDAGGGLTEFEVPGRAGTSAISRGPDGDLWYSNTADQIGSITTQGLTARLECPSSCLLPVTALTQGSDGRLWFATGVEKYEGGGGGALLRPYLPGKVGVFTPPVYEARIGSRPGRVLGHRTTVPIRCEGGAAGSYCKGTLRLVGHGIRSRRSFRIQTGGGRRLTVPLVLRAARRPGDRRGLRVRAITTVSGGPRQIRQLVLRMP
jgi:virginiamycin B lyase